MRGRQYPAMPLVSASHEQRQIPEWRRLIDSSSASGPISDVADNVVHIAIRPNVAMSALRMCIDIRVNISKFPEVRLKAASASLGPRSRLLKI